MKTTRLFGCRSGISDKLGRMGAIVLLAAFAGLLASCQGNRTAVYRTTHIVDPPPGEVVVVEEVVAEPVESTEGEQYYYDGEWHDTPREGEVEAFYEDEVIGAAEEEVRPPYEPSTTEGIVVYAGEPAEDVVVNTYEEPYQYYGEGYYYDEPPYYEETVIYDDYYYSQPSITFRYSDWRDDDWWYLSYNYGWYPWQFSYSHWDRGDWCWPWWRRWCDDDDDDRRGNHRRGDIDERERDHPRRDRRTYGSDLTEKELWALERHTGSDETENSLGEKGLLRRSARRGVKTELTSLERTRDESSLTESRSRGRKELLRRRDSDIKTTRGEIGGRDLGRENAGERGDNPIKETLGDKDERSRRSGTHRGSPDSELGEKGIKRITRETSTDKERLSGRRSRSPGVERETSGSRTGGKGTGYRRSIGRKGDSGSGVVVLPGRRERGTGKDVVVVRSKRGSPSQSHRAAPDIKGNGDSPGRWVGERPGGGKAVEPRSVVRRSKTVTAPSRSSRPYPKVAETIGKPVFRPSNRPSYPAKAVRPDRIPKASPAVVPRPSSPSRPPAPPVSKTTRSVRPRPPNPPRPSHSMPSYSKPAPPPRPVSRPSRSVRSSRAEKGFSSGGVSRKSIGRGRFGK